MSEQKQGALAGEFALIDRLKGMLPAISNPDIVIGIGDDAAVIRITADRFLVATCDVQIEGTHFRREWITPKQIGHRAMAVNLSDIAAMGGSPEFALVSLALPVGTTDAFVDELYTGIVEEAKRYTVSIIGGNMSRTEGPLSVDITLLGSVYPDQLLARSGARPGDRIYVSGIPGLAAAGLQVLERYGAEYPDALKPCVDAFLQPTPRVILGRALAVGHLADAMIDTSDGLSADLFHLCEASGVGCEINCELIPTNDSFVTACEMLERNVDDMQCTGGESYELLFTVPSSVDHRSIAQVASEIGVPCTEIGVVAPQHTGRMQVMPDGIRRALKPVGWDHFAR